MDRQVTELTEDLNKIFWNNSPSVDVDYGTSLNMQKPYFPTDTDVLHMYKELGKFTKSHSGS